MSVRGFKRTVGFAMLVALFALAPGRMVGKTREGSAATAQATSENASSSAEPAKAREEAAAEENENLKHSAMVRSLAKVTGMTVHQAHLVASWFNFLIVVGLIAWVARKFVPAALRNRTESIQRALEEGRAASEDANRRLAEIEARLSKLDSEIAQMQAQSEKEAAAEEGRIKQAAEEDIRKVVQAAEQEIASAAKQARRELSTHTADLAVALARKQIQVDAATDQVLVRNFTGNLSPGSSGPGGGKDRA